MAKRLIALLGLALLFTGSTAFADGFIVVHPPRPGVTPIPLAVKYHHVDVEINDQIATTTIDQVFVNPNNMQLEGTYIFPLPDGAVISRMSMWINGEEMSAELLDRDEADRIYTQIVRSMKDPAILEYMGDRMYRMRIFPIEARGEKRIKLEYAEQLGVDAGLITYRYPLSTEKFSSQPLQEVLINVKFKSSIPCKTLFSPSHDVDVVRKGDRDAQVTYEEKNVKPDKDFILYAGLSEQRFGAHLVCSKEKTQDGYFALFLAPDQEVNDGEVIPKDVVFVVDTSGSMKEPARKPWKIDQAKGALRFCVNSLGKDDRFDIISFSTTARSFRKTLQPVNNDTREEALRFVEAMDARGGTNIHDALNSALALQEEGAGRPFLVVFLTDGQPTVGELQKAEELVAFAGKHAGPSARIFVFGVGYDVNTHLLDKMALQNRGDRIYVSPEENIEVKVSAFYDKIANPVLSDLAVEIPGAEAYDLFPPSLPDLFRGSQMVLYGRYRNAGHSAVRLSGKVRGKPAEFVYEVNFPERSDAHTHIPRLWATMKIGFLLDQLRLKGIDVAGGQKPQGKDKELMDEIVALASEFGVVTPYTAMLVLEDARSPGGPATPAARRLREARDEDEAVAESVDNARTSLGYTSGEGAVGASKAARELKKGRGMGRKDAFSRALKAEETFKQVLDRTFVLVNGVWCDSRVDLDADTEKVAFLSDAYFALIKAHPKLARYLSVGERVKVALDGKVYEITS